MMEPLYLSENDKPTQIIRCPVHGFIRFSRNERKVIDHWVFQRLRRVRQLATTALIYPGAMHSRFEHSVGVMDLTGRSFEAVIRNHEQPVIEELRLLPEFKENTIARARQTLRLCGLLHDVGHPAFSHAAEKTIPGGDHEMVSLYVIREVLGPIMDEVFFHGISSAMVKVFDKSEGYTFLRQFVSSEMDMDRTDYLRRDSLHCGVAYGVFDYFRLIESLTVILNPNTKQLQLGIDRGGEHTFEALILARYQMNTQVYYHKLRRIYDHYLVEYMKSWGAGHYKEISDVLKYDDELVTVDIRSDAETDNERSIWARRIVNRNHHRLVYETGDNADIHHLRKAKRILDTVQTEFKGIDFILDDSPISIHKLAVPGDQEEKVEDIYIREKNDRLTLLAHDSAIISKVPKKIRTVRIFADATGDRRQEIRDRIRTVEKEL
jgi:uncharacterized protein